MTREHAQLPVWSNVNKRQNGQMVVAAAFNELCPIPVHMVWEQDNPECFYLGLFRMQCHHYHAEQQHQSLSFCIFTVVIALKTVPPANTSLEPRLFVPDFVLQL